MAYQVNLFEVIMENLPLSIGMAVQAAIALYAIACVIKAAIKSK
ncbi:hypothetical protein [Flavobacterium sp.]|nr:hypothetical protein [Flavobacterium sp.]